MSEQPSFASDMYESLELLERSSLLNWFLPTRDLIKILNTEELPLTPFSVYGFFFVPRSPGLFGVEWKISKQEQPNCSVIVSQGFIDEQ